MTTSHWLTTPLGKKRGRALGLDFHGNPGRWNAITDVGQVAVGYTTLIKGEGPLVAGSGPVRTGVTAILPRGENPVPCFAGYSSFNGNGEMTGTLWIDEIGQLQTPVTITNIHSCGVTRDATIRWVVDNAKTSGQDWGLPVAAETYDGELNDINGFHVTAADTLAALNGATRGPIELGSVGGGTGMCSYEFKAGSGSASRIVDVNGKSYTLGAFVQSNFGLRKELVVLGVPVGKYIQGGEFRSAGTGSIIAIIATDAPLMPHQLKRLVRRVPVGLARTGTIGHHGYGDIFLGFSTANGNALADPSGAVQQMLFLPEHHLDPLFAAVAETIEEAIIDSLIANTNMVGANGLEVRALPHHQLVEIMSGFGRHKS
ncbi:MAG: P1 family peptidase [Gammaproteobacteria bacterium]|nr:P1 family peptidase [Gammaproteobacteria bacterium]